MSLYYAAVIGLGVVVYIGIVLLICRFLSFSLGDIDHDNHS